MLIDSNLLFDPSGTAVTASADSTNVIDACGTGLPASPQGRDLGPGAKPLKARVCIQTALIAAGAATLQVQLLAAPDNGSGAAGTYAILSQTDAIPKANLVAGAYIDIMIPPAPPQMDPLAPDEVAGSMPRFYKLHYVVGTGPFTGGTVESMIVSNDADTNFGGYARNYTVS